MKFITDATGMEIQQIRLTSPRYARGQVDALFEQPGDVRGVLTLALPILTIFNERPVCLLMQTHKEMGMILSRFAFPRVLFIRCAC